MDVKDASLVSSLPGLLQDDPTTYAIAASIEAALSTAIAARNALNLLDVDGLPENILDILAWVWVIDWYDYNADITVKRATLRSAPGLHRRRGTPAAVKAVVSDMLGGEAALEEWYRYSGQPYHFRVVSSGKILDSAQYSALMAQLATVKNARSVIDSMLWRFDVSGIARATGHITGMGGAITLTQEVS